MKYFKKDFLEFFKELAANNNKDWFDTNRERYAKNVRDPFKVFVEDLIQEMGELDKKILNLEAKNAIFRINRDIRFSKDKTPYKSQVSAVVNAIGRKSIIEPGVYVQLDPEDMRVYSGIYQLTTEQMKNLKAHIVKNEKKFLKLKSDKAFVSTFGQIYGEKYKRIDKSLVEAAERVPELYNKQFYYFKKFAPSTVFKDDLMDIVIDTYKAAKDMSEFLYEGVNG